ncbi:MAG: hypothetical protein AB8U25_07260 [Rickettsiales endosymbiont of Dermacentor nuttalli]
MGRLLSRTDRTLHTIPDNKGITPMMLAFDLKYYDNMKMLFGFDKNPNIVLSDKPYFISRIIKYT